MAPQTYRVKTKKLSARHTAAVRVQSPPAQIADAFRSVLPEVVDSLTRQGVSAAGPPFARFFDYSDELADFEAGFPVAAPVAPEGRVAAGELPGGRVARTVHRGPYDDLQRAHDALGDWVLAHDHDPAGPVWEVYVTGPQQTDDPARWETEVVWPLRK